MGGVGFRDLTETLIHTLNSLSFPRLGTGEKISPFSIELMGLVDEISHISLHHWLYFIASHAYVFYEWCLKKEFMTTGPDSGGEDTDSGPGAAVRGVSFLGLQEQEEYFSPAGTA